MLHGDEDERIVENIITDELLNDLSKLFGDTSTAPAHEAPVSTDTTVYTVSQDDVEHYARRMLLEYNVHLGLIESRMIAVIIAGLVLAYKDGIEIALRGVKKEDAKGRSSNKHLTVYAHWKWSKALEFNCYLDGNIDVKTISNSAEGGFNIDNVLRCGGAVDIRNALIGLEYNKVKGFCSPDSGYTRHYLKYKAGIDKLYAESKLICEQFQDMSLPHLPINRFTEYSAMLTQVGLNLTERFIGKYIFNWDIKDMEATLDVASYTEDVLLTIKFELIKNNKRTVLNPEDEGDWALIYLVKAVSIMYKDSSGCWVALAEFSHIEWLDEVGDAVESILSSVFKN